MAKHCLKFNILRNCFVHSSQLFKANHNYHKEMDFVFVYGIGFRWFVLYMQIYYCGGTTNLFRHHQQTQHYFEGYNEQTLCIWSCGFLGCSTWPKKLVWTVGFWLLDNAASSWSGMTSSSKFAGSKIVGHMRMEPYYAGWRSFQSFIFATMNQK